MQTKWEEILIAFLPHASHLEAGLTYASTDRYIKVYTLHLEAQIYQSTLMAETSNIFFSSNFDFARNLDEPRALERDPPTPT